ncbi:TPA: phage major capsid protein [Clostridium perfringens]
MNIKELREKYEEVKRELRGLIDSKDLEGAKVKERELKEIREKLEEAKREEQRDKERLLRQKENKRSNLKSNKLGIEVIEKRDRFYDKAISDEEEELSLGKYIRGMLTGDWKGSEGEMRKFRALNTSTGTTVIPKVLSAKVIDLAREQMALSDIPIIPMESNNLTIARVKGDPDFGFKSELEKVTSSDMEFEPIELKSKTIYGLMQISLELLNSAQNIDAVIEQAMSKAVAQVIDKKGLYGNGDKEPKGILTYDNINIMESDSIEKSKYTSFVKGIGEITKANGIPNIIAYNSKIDTSLNLLTDTTGQPLNMPKSVESMTHNISNNIEDNQAMIYDNQSVVMGLQNQIRVDTSSEMGFDDGSVWLRVYAMVDFAILNPKNVTKITYRAE